MRETKAQLWCHRKFGFAEALETKGEKSKFKCSVTIIGQGRELDLEIIGEEKKNALSVFFFYCESNQSPLSPVILLFWSQNQTKKKGKGMFFLDFALLWSFSAEH